LNRPTNSLVATCTWRPAVHGQAIISAVFTPTSNAYFSSNTSRIYSVIKRDNLR
jgi:hypothetical protein